MAEITITLPEEQLKDLEALARRYGITTQELARLSVDDMLSKPDAEMKELIDFILIKNKELYLRLAK